MGTTEQARNEARAILTRAASLYARMLGLDPQDPGRGELEAEITRLGQAHEQTVGNCVANI